MIYYCMCIYYNTFINFLFKIKRVFINVEESRTQNHLPSGSGGGLSEDLRYGQVVYGKTVIKKIPQTK